MAACRFIAEPRQARPAILVLADIPIIRDQEETDCAFSATWRHADNSDAAVNFGDVRAIVTSSKVAIDSALLDRCPALEIVASFGVGYERIDTAAAAARGVVVTNTPDVLTEEVADLVIGLLIATIRRLPQADRHIRDGRWQAGAFPLSPSLRGRTVGIVGLGRIGKAIARRLTGFGVGLAYTGRTPQPDVSLPYHSSVLALAGAVDTLVLAAPGGDDTRHVVAGSVLKALGPDGVVINVGRGSLIDEEALAQALANRTILAAGLDVFAEEPNVPAALLRSDHTVLLPHVGSASIRTRDAMGRLVLDNLTSWFQGEGPLTPVPETPWAPPNGDTDSQLRRSIDIRGAGA